MEAVTEAQGIRADCDMVFVTATNGWLIDEDAEEEDDAENEEDGDMDCGVHGEWEENGGRRGKLVDGVEVRVEERGRCGQTT